MRFLRFVAIGLLIAVIPEARAQYYISTDIGGHFAPAVTFDNNSNDRSSVCDEYINPLFASVPGCTDPARGTGDGYKADFEQASGMTATIALGRQLRGRFIGELEYVYHHSGYNQVADIGAGIGVHQDKLTQEIFVAREVLGDVTAHNLMLNVYATFSRSTSDWVPYLGAGVGGSRVSTYYASTWYRNPNVDAIRTGEGLPNAEEVRTNLAGTMSNGNSDLTDNVLAWQAFAGLDFMVSDEITLGVRIRRMDFGELRSDDLVWDPLRSHVPNVRRDGSEPVNAFLGTDDFQSYSVGMVMRYHF